MVAVGIILSVTIICSAVVIAYAICKKAEASIKIVELNNEAEMQKITITEQIKEKHINETKTAKPKAASQVDSVAFLNLLSNVDSLWEDTVNDTSRNN